MESSSKSELKRQANKQRLLGARLTKLSASQLDQLGLGAQLRTALADFQGFRSNGARKRQLQYIAKILRSEDSMAIAQHLDRLTQTEAQDRIQFHELERWRDELLVSDKSISDYLSRFPQTPAHQLRDLIARARASSEKKHRRLLFRFLSENEKDRTET